MKGLSKVKSWLFKRGFFFVSQINAGDGIGSEYYQFNGFPITVRMGDHLGRNNTISDKYINILVANDSESYVLIIDKITKVITYKELTQVIDSLINLYLIIPDYLKFKNEVKKEFRQKESELQSEINNLNDKISANNCKVKNKLKDLNQELSKVCNSIVIEMNNL